MPAGYVAIVLHAHLPFVRHPEHRDHLEERWLFEAIAECYLPLLEVFERLADDRVPYRCTVSISPPLLAMLRDPLLCRRFELHLAKLDRLLERELERTQSDGYLGPVVRFYAQRQRRLWELWYRLGGDIAGAFRALEHAGHLELWTCGATHAFFPALVHHPKIIDAQVALATAAHRRELGISPRGMWLPECGFTPGVDDVLTRNGIAYTAVETHAIVNARPRPRFGTAAPILTPAGLACFGRDVEASSQVWSKEGGYPGDAYYREFYRDVGYDNAGDDVREFVAADGTRQATGLKYYRITGRGLAKKEPYIPSAARAKAREHARDFVREREAQARALAPRMGVPPVLFAPYDAELFGHWWFEGPDFLEAVLRELYASDWLASTTLGGYLERHPTHDVARPETSSWGAGGYAGVWLDPGTAWMLPHVDFVADDLVDKVRAHRSADVHSLRGRAVRQLVREAMLLLSSDWAFLITTGTAPHYARARFEAHLARYRRVTKLLETLAAGHTPSEDDTRWFSDLEGRDTLFTEVPLDWA